MSSLLKRLNTSDIAKVLIVGGGSAVVIKALGTGLQFLLLVLLGRALGAAQLGTYVNATAWMDVLVLLGKVGLDMAAFRYVAMYLSQQQFGLLKGFSKFSLTTSLALSTGLAVLIAAVLFVLNKLQLIQLPLTFLLVLPLLPLLSAIQVQSAVLRGLGSYVRSLLPYTALRHGFLLFIVFVLLLTKYPMTPQLAAVLTVIATAIAFVLTAFWLRQLQDQTVVASPAQYESKEWIRSSLPMMFVGSSVVLLNQSDILAIGFLLGQEAVGIYAPMSRLALLIVFGYQALNSVVKPKFSSLYTQKKMPELQKLVTWTTRVGFASSLLVGLGFLLFGQRIAGMFGREFIAGYPVLLVLIIGRIVDAATGPTQDLLVMTGYQVLLARLLFVSVVCNILLNILLIPFMGIVGAAIANSVTILSWNIVSAVIIRRRLGIKTTLI